MWKSRTRPLTRCGIPLQRCRLLPPAGLLPRRARCSFGKNRRPHRCAPNAGMRCVLPVSSRRCGCWQGSWSIYVAGADTSEPASASANHHHRSGDRHVASGIPRLVPALARISEGVGFIAHEAGLRLLNLLSARGIPITMDRTSTGNPPAASISSSRFATLGFVRSGRVW